MTSESNIFLVLEIIFKAFSNLLANKVVHYPSVTAEAEAVEKVAVQT